MATDKKIFVYSDQVDEFGYPPQSPFKTSRALETKKILASTGLLTGADRGEFAPKVAGRQVLEKFHTPRYLDTLKRAGDGYFEHDFLYMGLGTGDCPVFEHMYEYCAMASGATVTGAEQIISGQAQIAFNPSGGFHHAHADRASGFCYINDQVLGIITLTEAGKRVLYLDVDVHHGDGVQEAFYARSDVMTISLHQSGRTLFPGTGFTDETGTGEGTGCSVNVPLPVGTYDEAYLKAVTEIVIPLIGAYAPDVIVVEFGTDALAGDPLAGLTLTNNVYAEVVNKLLTFDKPILATGGGGYNVENTTRAWALIWAGLCGDLADEHSMTPMGGVMMQSSEWHNAADGLRDRALVPEGHMVGIVEPAIKATIEKVKQNIFAVHGL